MGTLATQDWLERDGKRTTMVNGAIGPPILPSLEKR